MLIRRKSATDDEYHHEDPLAVFGVITGANGGVLSSNVYDAFVAQQYEQGVSKTTQPATCYKAMSEPVLLTGSGGRGVVVRSRGFQVMGKKRSPAKKQACTSHPTLDCLNRCLKLGFAWVYCATMCLKWRANRACSNLEWESCDRFCKGSFGTDHVCTSCSYDESTRRYKYVCGKYFML